MGQGLMIGEPTGQETQRVSRRPALLAGAGFDVTTSSNIRN